MKIFTQIVLFALQIGVARLIAQTTNVLWYHKTGTAEGLSSQDFNFYVYVDSEGFSWIGSSAGLNRFNGTQVKRYRSDFRDSAALFGENIQSRFFEDQYRNLWFCTYEAVHCYDRQHDNFRHYFIADSTGSPVKEDYYVIHLEQDSLLWFRAGNGIYRINILDPDKTDKSFLLAKPLFTTIHFHGQAGLGKDSSVQYIFTFTNEKQAGIECFGIENGRLTGKHAFFDRPDRKLPVLGVFQLYFENKDNIWLSTGEGLAKWQLFNTETIRIFPFRFKGYSYFVPDGDRYFLTTFSGQGLFRFEKESGQYTPIQLRPVKEHDTPVITDLRNIYLDRTGVVWITVPFHGVIYASLHKKKFDAFPEPPFIRNNRPVSRNFIENPDGSIWSNYRGGIIRIDKNGNLLEKITLPPNASGVNYILKHPDGAIWAATTGGVFRCPGSGSPCEVIPGTEKIDFLYLYSLRCGQLLGTTLINGIFSIDKKNRGWRIRNVARSGYSGFTSVYEDKKHQIYVCRNESAVDLFACNGDSLHLTGTLPVNGAVNACYEDPDGQTLWIATAYGLVKTDIRQPGKSLLYFTQKDGLADNNVLSMAADNSGNLWLGTAGGLTSFSLDNKSFRNYRMADGMQSVQFDKFAALKRRDGAIWFGGAAGITVAPARAPGRLKTPAGILITEIKVNDTVPDRVICSETGTFNPNLVRKLVRDYKDNTLSFSFVAVDYADPAGTSLRYKMEGVDKTWVTLERGAPGFARYPNLPPNEYIFSIHGANSDGVWNETPRRLTIRILPPFWQTWWFRGSAGITLLVLFLGIVRYRINLVRKTEQLKRRIAENKMAALVAQMNPHFIFNSLQSINSYILKNDRQKASEYLGRFSRLMRMILENSRHTTHTLEKEKELLELYLKVESQRFKAPFHYSIDIDEALDPYETRIPGMMLQPFVENAIWHGLAHKEGPGTVRIGIHAENGMLKCTVTDDGAGRGKAAEIALQKGKTHKSRALQIVSERLQILFPKQQELCSIRYTDLLDDNGLPAGTKVDITLPAF